MRPALFSSGQEAGCEYLINSHQDSGGFTVLCCRTQTPQGNPSAQTRAMEHERSSTESCCDPNREEGPQRTERMERTINAVFFVVWGGGL